MMTKRKIESQIVSSLKQADVGVSVKEVCRQSGIASSTLYEWYEKYEGMQSSDVKRLKALEEESRRLKQIYADLSLKSQMQADIIKKL